MTTSVHLVPDRRPAYAIVASPPATLGISVVVPVRNEAEDVASLAAEITIAMRDSPRSWECLWVDDGSTDGTGYVLGRIAEEDSRHRVISLPRELGRSAALAAGLADARGEVFATLDGDGLDDPQQLAPMIALLVRAGADVVSGRRERARADLVGRVSSRIADAVTSWLTREQVRDLGCSLRVFRRSAVQGLFVFRGMHRFLPTLARLNGATTILQVPVPLRPRLRGTRRHGVLDGVWAGIADALAVRWLLARAVSVHVPSARRALRAAGGR